MSWCSITAPRSPKACRKRCGRTPKSSRPIWARRTMLRLEKIKSSYGQAEVLHGVSLEVKRGEVAALIGANGAGKTTLLMTVCGNPHARSGRVLFEGQDISCWPTDKIMRSGIAHVPEGRRIFPRMSVLENLLLGGMFQKPAAFAQELEKVFTLFPILKERQNQQAGTLSGGEQQMLALSRALMAGPRLLLLDEPSLGLAPLIVRQIFDAIRELNRRVKLTVFLVEQNAFHALKLAHRGYVMVNGAITLTGTGKELLERPEVKSAYLEGGRQEVQAAEEAK